MKTIYGVYSWRNRKTGGWWYGIAELPVDVGYGELWWFAPSREQEEENWVFSNLSLFTDKAGAEVEYKKKVDLFTSEGMIERPNGVLLCG